MTYVRIWSASLPAKGQSKGNREAFVRSAGRIDKAGCVVPGFPFFIGVIKRNRLCTEKSLII